MKAETVARLHERPGLGLDLIRIYLGLALFVRGVMFVAHPELLVHLMKSNPSWIWPAAISHYVIAAHLFGGLFLALGLGTRVAALVQVPALVGAIAFVHYGEGLLSAGQSLELVALVLALLLVFSIFGASEFSLDRVLRMRSPEVEEPTTSSEEAATHGLPAHR